MKKSCMENLNKEREFVPGQHLLMKSLTEGAGHRRKKWMKVDPDTKNAQGLNLWMISMIHLRDWIKTDIED